MKYLLTDIDDQSVYMTGQFFRDSAINPCIKSSYQFVEHVMQQVVDMHKVRFVLCQICCKILIIPVTAPLPFF